MPCALNSKISGVLQLNTSLNEEMSMEILNNIAKQFLTDANADGKIDIADVVVTVGVERYFCACRYC